MTRHIVKPSPWSCNASAQKHAASHLFWEVPLKGFFDKENDSKKAKAKSLQIV